MFIKPDYNVEKLEDIDFAALKTAGKSVLLFDLDSTLMPSKSATYLPRTKELLDNLQKDFTVAVITNNNKPAYISKVREISDFEIIDDAKKPSAAKIFEYLAKIGKTPRDAVMIGDRPLTDILAGILAGTTTVLVDSITRDSEGFEVRFVRWLERLSVKK